MFSGLCVAITFLAGLQAPEAGPSATVLIQEISRASATAAGQPIQLPRNGVQVIASIYTIPPGAALPVHKHPFPRYAYVLSGPVAVTSEDGRVFTYETGAFLIEMLDAWHHGSNPGKEPARLLVIDQVEPGTSNTILKEQ